jgi:hypothetical protein
LQRLALRNHVSFQTVAVVKRSQVELRPTRLTHSRHVAARNLAVQQTCRAVLFFGDGQEEPQRPVPISERFRFSPRTWPLLKCRLTVQ